MPRRAPARGACAGTLAGVRSVFPIAVAAVLLLGALLATVSDGAPGRARATALVASGAVGPQVMATSSGEDSQRRSGGVQAGGLTIRSGESIARTSTSGGTARATAVARSVDALDGLVTAYGVRRTLSAGAGAEGAGGTVEGLRIDGEMIGTLTARRRFDLPDGAGTVTVNSGGTGLRISLAKPRAGRPAGTEIHVAVVNASARAATAPRATPTPRPTATPAPSGKPATERRGEPSRGRQKDRDEPPPPPPAPPHLTQGGYAFPVYGDDVTLADDFGGPRQIGPHQGNDIFAAFGSPVLAVTDGRLFKVGTLPISGNRLWLLSDRGEAFFYAHLSSFSPLAVTGRRVRAGDVLGFVGNTGDAEPTPPHVHFEIHPGGLEQGATDPNAVLRDWQLRADVAPTAWLRRMGSETRDQPGALLEVRDFIAGE